VLHFDTDDERPNPRLSNVDETPLSVPFMFKAITLPQVGKQGRVEPFSGIVNIPEYSYGDEKDDTVGAYWRSIFSKYTAPLNLGHLLSPDEVTKFSSEKHTAIILVTQKGRLLVIPWSTKVRDIWAGARWPRSTPSPFQDIRERPIPRDFEVDGVTLDEGWFVTLYLSPKVKLDSIVASMEWSPEMMSIDT